MPPLPRSPSRSRPAPRSIVPLILSGLVAVGCSDLLHEGAPAGPAPLSLAWVASSPVANNATLADAFDRADGVFIEVRDPTSSALLTDTTLTFPAGADEVRLAFRVPMDRAVQPAFVRTVLLLDQAPLFMGSLYLTLRQGEPAAASVVMDPEPGSMRIDSLPAFTTFGEHTQLSASVFLATGDVLPGLRPVWSSLDPHILEVGAGGTARVMAEGTARVAAHLPRISAQGELDVVLRVDSVHVSPDSLGLLLDESIGLEVVAMEARGVPLEGRPVALTSSDSAVVRPDDGGRVQGVSIGEALITVTVDGVAADVPVRVRPPAPETGPMEPLEVTPFSAVLRSGGIPNRGPARGWFEWGPSASPASFQRTDPVDLGSGTGTVRFEAHLTGLIPGRTYHARAVVESVGGMAVGEIIPFDTPQILPEGPPSLTADPVEELGVELRWIPGSFNEDEFRVQWRRRDRTEFETIDPLPPGATAYTHLDTAWGHRVYEVRACNILGCSTATRIPVFVPFEEPTIHVAPDAVVLDLLLGSNRSLAAEVLDPEGLTLDRPILWASQDEGVATVDGEGRVDAVAPGTGAVTAAIDGGVTSTVPVRVLPPAAFHLDRVDDRSPGGATFLTEVFAPGRTAEVAVYDTVLDGGGLVLAVRTPAPARLDAPGEDVVPLPVVAPAVPAGRILNYGVVLALSFQGGPFLPLETRRGLLVGPTPGGGPTFTTDPATFEDGGWVFRGSFGEGNQVAGNPGGWIIVDGLGSPTSLGWIPDNVQLSSGNWFSTTPQRFDPEQRVEFQATVRTPDGFVHSGERIVVQAGDGRTSGGSGGGLTADTPPSPGLWGPAGSSGSLAVPGSMVPAPPGPRLPPVFQGGGGARR